MNKRIILLNGCTETLAYFSKQLAVRLKEYGHEIFIWDMRRPTDSRGMFEMLPDKEQSLLITFNFNGLGGEGQFADGASNIWDKYNIPKICIMVDSPIYYFRQLSSHMDNLYPVCIDKNHLAYMRRWYPEYGDVFFMPLAGNLPINDIWLSAGIMNEKSGVYINDYDLKPLDQRKSDLLFIGNFVTTESLMPAIMKAAPDYREFIMDVCDFFLKNPENALETGLETKLREQFTEEGDELYPETMFHMIFVDLYIRTYFREKMICTLADEGFIVHCMGKDWEKAKTKHPENIIHTWNMMTSADCVNALADAKISLNIMPWFKDGAHDRIFSSLLAGCVCVTDSSKYLEKILTPWEDHVPFRIDNMQGLCDNLQKTMKDSSLMEKISSNGRKLALAGHTWSDNADILESFLKLL